MPRVLNLQTSFNSGVLDPRLAARTDLKHFYQGAAEATNVQSLPQGGMTRRPGLKHVGIAGNASVGSETRLAAFAFNVEQTYLFVFTPSVLEIYKDDTLQKTLTTPYLGSELSDIQWTQSADTMIVIHENHRPRKIMRGDSHTSWTIDGIIFKEYPTYDFNQNYDSITFKPQDNGSETDFTKWNKIGRDLKIVKVGNPPSGEGAAWTANHVGGLFDAGGGIVRITGVSNDLFFGKIIKVFDNEDSSTTNPVFSGDECLLEEKVWSTAGVANPGRGWPKSATFYQGRMWFGGSRDRPQTMWGSVTNDFFNFDLGTGLDDEGLDLTLDTDMVNAITAVYAGRHLQIFTTGGEFSIHDIPITPKKSAVRRQTLYGSTNIPPKSIDGSTLFIDRTGKSVREFLFAYAEDAYTSGTVSLLASHLLNSPVDMDVLRGTGKADANYVYFVNTDGTVAVFNTLRAQEVGGWTKWTTQGNFEGVCTVVEDVYFVVNENGFRHVAKLDDTCFTDMSHKFDFGANCTNTINGLAHFNGQEVRVVADGVVMETVTPTNGTITLDRQACKVEVGLNFDVKIKTMPINQDFQDGPTLTRKKRIVRVTANVYETLGVRINGELLVDRNLGMPIGLAVPPFTGTKVINLLGWSELAQIEITQTDPLPLTVLGIGLEVEA
jgi:hypothetical protein